MSGTFVLKSEKGRYRFILQDEGGKELFKGTLLTEKDRVVKYMDMMRESDDLTNNLQALVGPDGSHYFRGELHTSKEGQKGVNADGTPLGFSATFKSEKEMEEVRQAVIKAAKGAAVKDET